MLRGFKKTAHTKITQRIQEIEHACVWLESGRHRPKMPKNDNCGSGGSSGGRSEPSRVRANPVMWSGLSLSEAGAL